MHTDLSPNISSYKVVPSLKLQNAVALRFWWTWFFAIVVVSLIFLATFEFAPYLFMDELMNVDLGRTILNPDTNWSVAWLTEANKPVFLLSYIGPVLQEFSYQTLGELGPRISAFLGALAAATVLVGWLLCRGTAKTPAFIFGLAFLLDPLFVQAYSTGRVDGLTMALCLSSCWLLRHSNQSPLAGTDRKPLVVLAGALAVFAIFTWPSAGFLFPLIGLELAYLAKEYTAFYGRWQAAASPVLLFAIGGLAAGVLLLIPIAPQMYDLFGSIVEALKVNTRHGGEAANQTDLFTIVTPFIELLRVLKFTFVLLLVAMVSVFWKRDVSLVLCMLLVAFLMMSTVVYISRVQYLLPYLFVSAAAAYQLKAMQVIKPSMLKLAGLVLILSWSVGLTLFARTVVAYLERGERDRKLLSDAAMEIIGPGSHAVALFYAFEFYYAGRSLGWKMYAPYKPAFENISVDKMKDVLAHVDYAVIPQEHMVQEYVDLLEREGMHDSGTFQFYENPVNKDYVTDHSKTTYINRLHIVYRIPRQPYGPYRLFSRGGVAQR